MNIHKQIFLLFVFLSLILVGSVSPACTRILKINANSVLVGRNMDWGSELPAALWIYPRGIQRYGMAPSNSMQWKAKYASLVATVYDSIFPTTVDGFNEKGLATHLLSLPESDYGKRIESLPAISVIMWAQFYLDNFQTVAEAVQFTQNNHFQITPFYDVSTQKYINLHIALEDVSGDSAIIEYTNGFAHIYHNPVFTVLTNSPTYPEQLENLRQYQGFGGVLPLPGTTLAKDRFVRASYYANHLPKFSQARDEIIALLSVLSNVSQPLGEASAERPTISKTIWRVIADLKNRIYYYQALDNSGLIWANLDKFDLREGSSKYKLELKNQTDLIGDVSNKFKKI